MSVTVCLMGRAHVGGSVPDDFTFPVYARDTTLVVAGGVGNGPKSCESRTPPPGGGVDEDVGPG